jgi:non-specific protein-tyrosine kinase
MADTQPNVGGAAPERGFDIRDYLNVLRRRKAIVIVAVGVTVGVAVFSSVLQTPIYAAQARVLLTSDPNESLFGPSNNSSSDPQRAAETEVEVVESAPVAQAVQKAIGSAPGVSPSVVTNTNVLAIKARNTSAATAAKIANAYANAYVDVKRKQRVDDLLATSSQVQSKIDDIGKQISTLDGEAATASPSQLADINQQRDALFSQQATFRQTLAQLQVETATASGGAQLVTPAVASGSPVEPKPIRSLALALILGLVLGIAVALGVEYLDDSIKSMDDLERAGDGTPVIAVIPRFGEARERGSALVTRSRQTSAAAEAFRSLRTSVQFMGLDAPMRIVQVTSPNAAEGKTTTVANLGVAIAGTGTRVVIIDFDLRRPRLHEIFELNNDKGFTSVLLGQVDLNDALREIPGTHGMARVLTSGPLPPNPSELLSSPRVQKLIDEVAERVDVVVLDTPPVLPVTDALVVSRCVDAVLLVTAAGTTTRRVAQRAVELLRQVGAPLRGLVLNRASDKFGYGYGYGYGYGAGDDGSQERSGRRSRAS